MLLFIFKIIIVYWIRKVFEVSIMCFRLFRVILWIDVMKLLMLGRLEEKVKLLIGCLLYVW